MTSCSSTRSTAFRGPSRRSSTRRWRTLRSTWSIARPRRAVRAAGHAAVHPGRRDDPLRHAQFAASRPFRLDLPAGVLRRRHAHGHRWPFVRHPRRRSARRRSQGDRAAVTRHPADRQPDPAPRPRPMRCASRRGHRHRATREALRLLEIDEQASTLRTAASSRRLVHKFDGGPVASNARAATRKRRYDHGCLRALPHSAGYLQRTARGRVATPLATVTWASFPRTRGTADALGRGPRPSTTE